MSPALLRRCFAARVTRCAVLALVALGHLPVPVVHAHGTAGGPEGSASLARHVALFHGGDCDGCCSTHLHVVPPFFLAGGGTDDASGSDVPDGAALDVPPPTADAGRFAPAAAFDAPAPAAPSPSDAPPAGPSVCGPRQFVQTFSCAAGLVGLLGVCRR